MQCAHALVHYRYGVGASFVDRPHKEGAIRAWILPIVYRQRTVGLSIGHGSLERNQGTRWQTAIFRA